MTRLLLAGLLLSLALPAVAFALTAAGEQKLVPPTADDGDEVGWSVDWSGGVVAIGAPQDSTLGASSGAVHVYDNTSGVLAPLTKLTASDGVARDELGISVAASGDTIAAGAFHRFTFGGPAEQGRAYIFRWDGVAWVEEAKLVAPDGVPNDAFGWSIALQGDLVAIGAPRAWSGGPLGAGAVYLFERSDGEWSFLDKITRGTEHSFGWSVDIDGDTLVVGSQLYPNHHVAVYQRDGFGDWNFETEIDPDDDDDQSEFGNSVGLDGDDLVVGAWFDTTGGNFGAAYFFHREGGDWVQVQKINSLGGARAEVFGEAVAIDDGLAVITDSGLDRDLEFEDMGAAYVYRRGASAWSLGATITPGDYATYTTYFGTAAAVRGSSILIGAAYAWDEPSETYPGAAYAYSIARGSKLLIKNANPDNEFQNRIVFKGKGLVADVPLPGSGDDPTCAGGGTASITVSSATSGASFTQTLPCANWAQTPRGYRYVDPELDDGACRLVDFSPARTTAKAVCAGSGPSVLGYDIEPGQEEAPVVVRLTLGATSYCTVFGGTVKNDGSDGQKFLSIQAGPTEPCATP